VTRAAEIPPANAAMAAQLVPDGQVVGLGTGRAAAAFIRALGERVRGGLRVRGVPTSQASDELARQVGIPLVSLDEVETLDLTVDGADEVDPQLNLIKGYGAALVREKIVAAASKRLVILVGPEKLVPLLGSRGKIPIEVVPFGVAATIRHLRALGLNPEQRIASGQPVVTDNGNVIVDGGTGPIANPAKLEAAIRAIPGVVGTGLFLGMADTVLVERGEQVQELTRSRS
jgi:ribose 5-phosphate isomerase A